MMVLALHSSVVIPALIAMLGAIALAIDVIVIRPRRRLKEKRDFRDYREAKPAE